MASTKKINEYLNNNEDINDRVQKIISSIGKEEELDTIEANIDESSISEQQDSVNIVSNKTSGYSRELLLSYYNNLTDDEKNNVVSFVNCNMARNNKNRIKSYIALLLIFVLNVIRCIGIVFAKILFSKSIVESMYVLSIGDSINKDTGGDESGQ